ncbi:MAG TPA: LCP family protein [Ktedonobacterales bacterium]|nr:LCP family protein [Ktedonobacterales bacterium]
MSYTPGPQDDWADWDGPTSPRTNPPAPAYSEPLSRTRPLGVFGQGAPAQAAPAARRHSAPPLTTNRPPGRTRRRPRVMWTLLLVAIIICVALGIFANRALAFGSAISPQAPLSTQTGYMSGVGRINVVVLGYGGAGHDGAYLSDSLMVMSLSPSDRSTTMISVPRDLWVQIPPNSGQYSKINAAFADGVANGYDASASGQGNLPSGQLAGGLEAAAKVSDVTGMDVPYFMTINFQGFRALVDALGGVDINVPTAFTANYPINDDPAINAGWKVIHFNTGVQHMNGEQAIEYARARYVLSPASEGTDFARSARQQLLIRAIASRMRSPSAWPGLSNAMTALQKAIYTNLSLADLTEFTLKLDFSHAAHVGLSTSNVLVGATSSDGQDILLPENGDWNAIKQYIKSNLKQ